MSKRAKPERPLCRATTTTGAPCRSKAVAGSAYCSVHGGARRKIGRPTKLDDGTAETIALAVELGASYEVAAQAAGIHPATFARWREQGETDLEDGKATAFAALCDRLHGARAVGEVELLRRIRGHAPLDWRAAAWLLERRHPDRWGRRDKVSVDGEVRSRPRDVTPEGPARDTILELLAAATRPPAGAET